MPIVINDLVLRVRDLLNDYTNDRFDTPLIVRNIIRGVEDFGSNTEILEKYSDEYTTTETPSILQLPDEVITLTKVWNDGNMLPIIPHHELDGHRNTSRHLSMFLGRYKSMHSCHNHWEEHCIDDGRYTHIVYDKMVKGRLRLYPAPTQFTFREYSSSEDDLLGSLIYPTFDVGLIQYFDDDDLHYDDSIVCVEPPSYIVTDTPPLPTEGILISFDIEELDKVKFYYTYKIPYDDTNIYIDDTWSNAIVHYTVGMLLRGDREEHSRSISATELRHYAGYVQKALSMKAVGFTRGNQYETHFRRI